MKVLEKLKGRFDVVRFLLEHDTTPAMADRARGIYLLHKASIDFWLDVGAITEQDITSELIDPQNIALFDEMMRNAESLSPAKKALTEFMLSDLSDQPAVMAAFSRFQLERMEKRWNLRLVSPEED